MILHSHPLFFLEQYDVLISKLLVAKGEILYIVEQRDLSLISHRQIILSLFFAVNVYMPSRIYMKSAYKDSKQIFLILHKNQVSLKLIISRQNIKYC